MKALRHLERIQLIHDLIMKGFTGSPDELARRLNISRRTLYNYIEIIKSFGVEIDYCRTRKTFLILNNKRLNVYFGLEVLDKEQLNDINGGAVKFPFPCFFSAPYDFSFTKVIDTS